MIFVDEIDIDFDSSCENFASVRYGYDDCGNGPPIDDSTEMNKNYCEKIILCRKLYFFLLI